MTSPEAPVEQVAATQNEDKQKFLSFVQELTGLDFPDGESGANVFEIFDAIMNISRPGGMSKMTSAVDTLKAQKPDANPEEKLEAATGAANQAINEIKQEQENAPIKETVGLGGVNGTAFTTIVDKKPDNIIEGSAIKPAIQEGDPLITSTFNVNVNAVGTMVDATIDNDASSQINFDITKPAANNDQFSITA